MDFTPGERPFGIQLFGKEPDALARAVKEASLLKPDFIDFNCGCPAKKVFNSGSGAALMGNLSLLESILATMRDSTSLPLSIKIRSGINKDNINAVDVARLAEKFGFDAVIVHPRTVSQSFGGHSDWNIIRQVREAVSIPVIGNGDIHTRADMDEMLETTGCDLVMVGRGAMGKPWIFAQLRSEFEEPSMKVLRDTVIKHYKMMLERKGEYVGVREMRKHLVWYSKGLPGASEFRSRVVRIEPPEEVMAQVNGFFDPSREILPVLSE